MGVNLLDVCAGSLWSAPRVLMFNSYGAREACSVCASHRGSAFVLQLYEAVARGSTFTAGILFVRTS